MSALSALSTAGLRVPTGASPERGADPDLRWIEISVLFVDLDYQRRLAAHSRRAIERIAAAFEWAHFGAVVVAPAGDFFAIIDGQHRTTAAKLIGLTHVPCIIVAADKAAQARAFVAANRERVRPHALQIHAAAVAAGDLAALEIERCCAEAGVKLYRSPQMKPTLGRRGTNATRSIAQAIGRFGFEPTRLALAALSNHGGAFDGILTRDWILPAAELCRDGEAARFDGRDLHEIDEAAGRLAGAQGGRRQARILELLRREPTSRRADEPTSRRADEPTSRRADERAIGGLRPGVKVIDWRGGGDVTAAAMGDPPPGRSALAQREQAKVSGGSR